MAFDSGGGGHAVLLLRAGTFPTLLDQDFTFSAQEYVQGPQARATSTKGCRIPHMPPCQLQNLSRPQTLLWLKRSWLL